VTVFDSLLGWTLFLIENILAIPAATMVASTPGNLVVLALIFGPMGCLWSLVHGYAPRDVALRALQWTTAPMVAGGLLVLLGVAMEPWPGLDGWTVGAARGATFGAAAAGLRLLLLEP
jgi:hypothetical protein